MSELEKKSFIDTIKGIISHFRKQANDDETTYTTANYNEQDLAYMQSLSAAVVQHEPRYSLWVIGTISVTFFLLLVWAAWAELDTIVKAQGKVIPSSYIQKIQSLEGGIISEILVREGQSVNVNQALIKISDIPFASSYEENRIKYFELKARIIRLKAESNASPFTSDEQVLKNMPALLVSEEGLFISNKKGLVQSLKIFQEQLYQAEHRLLESKSREKQLLRSLSLVKKELKITRPLVEKKVVSEVDFLQLQGREVELQGEIDTLNLSFSRVMSIIDEAKSKLNSIKLEHQNKARKELNLVTAEVARLTQTQTTLADRVARTTLRSPVKGTVKRIFIKTIGGVVRPGYDIVEIVPSEDILLVEAKIKPADIANVRVGQTARIKFTAYDFAIYGSLKGIVRFISADTITDENGNSFYVARIEPKKSFLGHIFHKRYIKVGMRAEIDVIIGKKTILSYLLKPINRAMDNALRER